jgi:hypothetical protein
MNAQPPQATYSFTVQANIDGVTAPLQIHGESMNELRHAVRLLKEHGLLVEPPDVQLFEHRENGNGDAPKCHVHHRPMKQSQYGGWFCPVKDASGSYCKVKQS